MQRGYFWTFKNVLRQCARIQHVVGVVVCVGLLWGAHASAKTITVNGDISDWADVPVLATDTVGDIIDSACGFITDHRDLRSIKLTYDVQNVYFLVQYGRYCYPYNGFGLIFDTDSNVSTGCNGFGNGAPPIGADVVLALDPGGSFLSGYTSCAAPTTFRRDVTNLILWNLSDPTTTYIEGSMPRSYFPKNTFLLQSFIDPLASAVSVSLIDGPFKYPVDLDHWSKRFHGFGSLNLKSAIRLTDPYAPHLGEDWNIDTGGDTDKGRPIVSVADGTVLAIDYECLRVSKLPKDAPLGATCESTTGWGVTILVEHVAQAGQYFLTGRGEKVGKIYVNYAHLLPVNDPAYNPTKNIQVPPGGLIKKGDPIGQVGSPPASKTGITYPYHLHLEMLLQADAKTYRKQAGYGWDLTNYVDVSEFIANNLAPHFDAENASAFGTHVIVHTYGEGSSVSSPLHPQFLLDGSVPFRGVIAKKDKGKIVDASVNPCDVSYKINNWQRAGCNYGDFDLGYNGEIFWKPADNTGTAKWIPNLRVDGSYRVSVFIPVDAAYAKGIASYDLEAPLSGVSDTFAIDQSNYRLIRNGITSDTSEVQLNPGGNQHGAWVTVGTYMFKAGDATNLRLSMSASHQGQVSENVAADAVRFTYLGQ